MAGARTIGVGVIGLGFMGQTHVRAYQSAARDGVACELRAVCDASPERLTGEARAGGNLAGRTPERGFDRARVRASGGGGGRRGVRGGSGVCRAAAGRGWTSACRVWCWCVGGWGGGGRWWAWGRGSR